MTQRRFETGDIVRLRSGGPSMTVMSYSDFSESSLVTCQWFGGTKLNIGHFEEDTLEADEPDPED